MASFRRSLGRSVSPMERVKIAAARDPRIPPPPIGDPPFPLELPIKPSTSIQLFYTQLGSHPILRLPLEPLEYPEINTIPTRLTPVEVDEPFVHGFTFGIPSELTPLSSKEFLIHGPKPLPRSYQLVEDETGRTTAESSAAVELIRPLLEKPLEEEDGTPSPLLESLRGYQREAIEKLLSNESLLIADDPGLGKRGVVSIALRALYQRGLVGRTLIVCPEWSQRYWAAYIAHWAPSISLTVVQGDSTQRGIDWVSHAHIYLTDFHALAEDIKDGHLAGRRLTFDILILDSAHALRFQTQDIARALSALQAPRRWALAGAPPNTADGWLFIFNVLTPELIEGTALLGYEDVVERFSPYVLRRKKTDLADDIPVLSRQLIWLDMDQKQRTAYEATLVEEQNRLSELGSSVSKSDIHTSIERLTRICNFTSDWSHGVKVQALIDLVEEVTGAGSKVVVFSQFGEDGVQSLHPLLEAYGALCLTANTPESERHKILEAFKEEVQWHVLLIEVSADIDTTALDEATYIAHFDHNWNPGVRRRAELHLHPPPGPRWPIHIYEYWVADTIDERLFNILSDRGLTPDELPGDTRTKELEDRLTLHEWLSDVLQVSPIPDAESSIEAPPVELDISPTVPDVERTIEMPISDDDEIGDGDIIEIPMELRADEADLSFEVEAEPLPDSVEGAIFDVLSFEEEIQEQAVDVGLPADDLEVEEDLVPEDLFETEVDEEVSLATPPERMEEPPSELEPLDELEFIETLLREEPLQPEPEELPTVVSPPTLEEEPEEADLEEESLATEEERPRSPGLAVTGLLPGDALKDAHWARVIPEALMEEVKLLMQALGYPEADILTEPDEKGGDLLAWREKEGHIKKVLVRCIRSTKNVGVRQARSLIKAMETREDCLGAYLVTTSDFTQSCRNLASESGGKLDLVSGAEFYRHLHILGRS